MNVVSSDSSGATLQLSDGELRILNNAMNETLEAIDDEEFDTRVGATRGEVSALLDEVHDVIVSLPG